MRPSEARAGRQRGSARCEMQKISAGKFQFDPPSADTADAASNTAANEKQRGATMLSVLQAQAMTLAAANWMLGCAKVTLSRINPRGMTGAYCTAEFRAGPCPVGVIRVKPIQGRLWAHVCSTSKSGRNSAVSGIPCIVGHGARWRRAIS